jgi:hypothetical protein
MRANFKNYNLKSLKLVRLPGFELGGGAVKGCFAILLGGWEGVLTWLKGLLGPVQNAQI